MKKNTTSSHAIPTSDRFMPAPAARTNENGNPYANHESISRRAYELWQEAGNPEGRENEFWLEAEQQLNDVARANRSQKG